MAALIPISFAIFRELIRSLLLLFFLSVFILFLLYIAPGNYLLEEYLSSLQQSLSHDVEVKINLPFMETYFLWLGSYLTGNFGVSSSNGMPVMAQVIEYTINTLTIVISALFVSLSITLPMALLSAKKTLSIINKPIYVALNLLSTLPLFWLCYIAIYLSTTWLNYFPLTDDFENIALSEFVLPILLLTLGSGVLIEMVHLISNELNRVMSSEYILYARAKGANILFHALKEGVIFPVLNFLSNRVAYLFSASIIVEQIFNWPGLGRILWQSAQERDVALLLSAVLASAVIIRLFFFTTRVTYILLNPRASHE